MMKVGMKVNVVRASHCNYDTKDNHAGSGTVIEVQHDDSFCVQMDDHPDERWWRCGVCTEDIDEHEESIDIIKMRLQYFQGREVALSNQEYTELYDALENLRKGD